MSSQNEITGPHRALRIAAAYRMRAAKVTAQTLERCSLSTERRAKADEQVFSAVAHLTESVEVLSRLGRRPAGTTQSPPPTALASRPNVRPAQVQIAAYVLEPPTGRRWIHELKQDG